MSAFGDFVADTFDWCIENIFMPLILLLMVGGTITLLVIAGSCAHNRIARGECVAVDPMEVESVGYSPTYTTYIQSGKVMVPITQHERWWANVRGERSKDKNACALSVDITQGQYEAFIQNGTPRR